MPVKYKDIKTFEERYSELDQDITIASSEIQIMMWAEIEELRDYMEAKLKEKKHE